MCYDGQVHRALIITKIFNVTQCLVPNGTSGMKGQSLKKRQLGMGKKCVNKIVIYDYIMVWELITRTSNFLDLVWVAGSIHCQHFL